MTQTPVENSTPSSTFPVPETPDTSCSRRIVKRCMPDGARSTMACPLVQQPTTIVASRSTPRSMDDRVHASAVVTARYGGEALGGEKLGRAGQFGAQSLGILLEAVGVVVPA